MKKIVALALCLALALALCTVAFGVSYTNGKAYEVNEKVVVDATADNGKDVAYTAADADDQEIAYYTVSGSVKQYVISNKLTATVEYAIKGADGWTYLVPTASYEYAYAGTLAGKTVKTANATCVDFSYATGGEKVYAYVNDDGDTVYCLADDVDADGDNLLVDGKLIGIGDTIDVGAHDWTYTFDTDKVTVLSRTCAKCGEVQKVVKFNDWKLLKAAAQDQDGTVYYQIVTAGKAPAAAGTTTTGVSSAKTFDAGVALYAGMALMSVAGSAVVIGKKKEF